MQIQSTNGAMQSPQFDQIANVVATSTATPSNSGGGSVAPPVSGVPNTPTSVGQPVSTDQVKNAVDTINNALQQQQAGSSLEFTVAADNTTPVVKVVDKATGDVIRQMPSEETLAIAKSIDQYLQQTGLLVKQTA